MSLNIVRFPAPPHGTSLLPWSRRFVGLIAQRLCHFGPNHPFVDVSKRAGLLAALVFLDIKGISITRDSETLYELNVSAAEGASTSLGSRRLERVAKSG